MAIDFFINGTVEGLSKTEDEKCDREIKWRRNGLFSLMREKKEEEEEEEKYIL
jgi:hypothetical protein